VKYVARVIRGEHEYKANTEVLIEKIFNLLEYGLDDTVHDWNETKQAELSKYIKSQKRAGRKRSRRSGGKDAEPSAVDNQVSNQDAASPNEDRPIEKEVA
jgi:hypothetical protein